VSGTNKLFLLAPIDVSREMPLHQGDENELPKASASTAARGSIDRDNCERVRSRRLCTTERAIGALEKASPVSLCVPDARKCHVKKKRDLS
jgi:hypothetical protein